MNVTETLLTLKNLLPRQSVLIRGAHGTGKSDVVRQATEELSIEEKVPYQLIDLRLSQKEVGDLIGMPRAIEKYTGKMLVYENGKLIEREVINEEVTVFNKPSWFPTDKNSRGILFLDELNRGTREVQQAAFELVLDYRLNFNELPEGWRVVSAINDDSNVYSVIEIDPALRSRFLVIDFDPTVQEWLDWSKRNKINDAVVKYITKFDKNLDSPAKMDTDKSYPNRRSWAKLGKIISNFEDKKINLFAPDKTRYFVQLAAGMIGVNTAVHFQDFIKKDYKVLNASDILNKMTDAMEEELKALAALDCAYYNTILIEHIKEKRLKKSQEENFMRFFKAIKPEAAGDLWTGLLRECKTTATALWNSTPELSKLISTTFNGKPPVI